MTTHSSFSPPLPLDPEQFSRIQSAISGLSPAQLAWLSGYLWAKVVQNPAEQHVPAAEAAPLTVTIIAASQTGNARRLAQQLCDDLLAVKINAQRVNAEDYKFKLIGQERCVVMVTSTQGEGEPPEEAVALYKFLMSPKAPALAGTAFAVFGLGDSSYEFFCQAGKDVDQRLAALGGERLLARVDADVEYAADAARWREQLVSLLASRLTVVPVAPAVQNRQTLSENQYTREAPLTAKLLLNQKITGRHSDKDIRHIEIATGDAPLHYQPGDALGVWYQNDPALVAELLALLCLNGDEAVQINGLSLLLSTALQQHRELTVNTPQLVEAYGKLAGDDRLRVLANDKAALLHYAQATPLVEMVRQAPAALDAEQLITLLRPLTPRLYSIASSPDENPGEVHITVGAVRYKINDHLHAGGASSYLADRLEEGADIRVFIEPNERFRLPADPQAPIIMIGPGTGVAPFRAFMQQRDGEEASGKNWLFFGNPHFTEDFLYQVEWQRYVKEGLLTHIDLAWSRDQQHKIYVQDKLRQQGEDVWRWIGQGAYVYVCGDAKRMARDVEQALLEIIMKHGKMAAEQADEFLSELRIARRYQRDVY